MEDISRDIIIKASRNDIAAFEDIYRKTSVFVYNVALRIAGSTEDADEITQDVFMKVYKHLHKFNFLSSFKTWVYRITVNTAINYEKAAEKHVSQRADYDTALNVVSTEEAARDNINKQAKEVKISALLGALDPDQRACIVLREIEGMNYREIANALKVNINTVRTRLKRARTKLLSFAKRGDNNEL